MNTPNCQKNWTLDELTHLYDAHIKHGFSASEIAQTMPDRSASSIRKKLQRIDWLLFAENPEGYTGAEFSKKWTQTELLRLDTFLQSGQSYRFIAQHMDRSPIAVERKSQEMDWLSWREAQSQDGIADEELQAQLSDALIVHCRHDYSRLNELNENEFLKKINFEKNELPVSFSELKNITKIKLDQAGLGNPETLSLKKGTYIVIGDSHGKHTPTNMFDLVRQVSKHVKANNVIHIGHLLDDDNDISYNWGDIQNLIVLAKTEELKFVQSQRQKFRCCYDIVRDCVLLGDLVVMNQDMITDYVKTPIGRLDSEIFDSKIIVNCHRMEIDSKASGPEENFYVVSPGAICEQHIIKTIKQIDFTGNRTVKVAYHDGFQKYRRMAHNVKYWNQGLLVVHVDDEGNHTIVPCVIKKIGKDKSGKDIYATSYFDKIIISSSGATNPDKKIFITCDKHCPKHDPSVLDIQEQICNDYGADILVNLGDDHDYRSLNHHDIDRGIVIFDNLLRESAEVHHTLKRQSKWAKECHLLYGNHERFGLDFTKKFPQLKELIEMPFICEVEEMGYNLTPLKTPLKIGDATFIHGDMTIYGQSGSKLEKSSRVYGHNVFIGHIHYPAIRFGCYSAGFAGLLDQEYNEPNASRWMAGFSLCNQYKGKSWPTCIAIEHNNCVINKKVYTPQHPENWKLKKFTAKLIYETE